VSGQTGLDNIRPQEFLIKECAIPLAPSITAFIISMTKLLDADWLRGVQLFH
jgi:hypothetical protein